MCDLSESKILCENTVINLREHSSSLYIFIDMWFYSKYCKLDHSIER